MPKRKTSKKPSAKKAGSKKKITRGLTMTALAGLTALASHKPTTNVATIRNQRTNFNSSIAVPFSTKMQTPSYRTNGKFTAKQYGRIRGVKEEFPQNNLHREAAKKAKKKYESQRSKSVARGFKTKTWRRLSKYEKQTKINNMANTLRNTSFSPKRKCTLKKGQRQLNLIQKSKEKGKPSPKFFQLCFDPETLKPIVDV